MIQIEPAAAGSVFGSGLQLARRYAEILAGVGVERGLIGPREAERIWSRHLLNCAVLAELIAGGTVLDVGSGAGLPGIPLAIVRPECTFTLVEPLERRTVFLKEVVSELGLENVTVVRGRADDVTDQHSGADFVTSRAVAPLAKLAFWSVPLARRGGQVLAIKGASAAAEIERDGAAAGRLGLAELEVLMIGATVVQPPTTVIRGVVVGTAGRRRASARH